MIMTFCGCLMKNIIYENTPNFTAGFSSYTFDITKQIKKLNQNQKVNNNLKRIYKQ